MLSTLMMLWLGQALSNPLPEPPPKVDGAEERFVLEVVVEDGRYVPDTLKAPAGVPIQVRFLRKEWSACTKEVVFDDLSLRRELPTDQAVTIDLPASKPGEIPFHCGMGMVRGTIEVEAE